MPGQRSGFVVGAVSSLANAVVEIQVADDDDDDNGDGEGNDDDSGVSGFAAGLNATPAGLDRSSTSKEKRGVCMHVLTVNVEDGKY